MTIQETSLSTSPEVLETQGIRKNHMVTFTFKFSGQDVYDLLLLLEESARLETVNYAKVRAFVLAAETIREQAKAQGF